MNLTLVTAAAAAPLTAAQVRLHCSIAADDDGFDTLLNDYIAAAWGMIEAWTGRAMGAQTWKLTTASFADEMLLDRGPVTGITHVKYLDPAGALQTLDVGTYLLDITSDPARLLLAPDESWPAVADRFDAVQITFVTGFVTMPATMLHALRVTVAAWFQTREATSLPAGVTTLLDGHRAHWIAA